MRRSSCIAYAAIFYIFFGSLPAQAQDLPSPTLRFCESSYNVYFSEDLIKRFTISNRSKVLPVCFEKLATKMSTDLADENLHVEFFRSKTGGLNRIEVRQIEFAVKPDSVVLDKLAVRGSVKNLVNAENENLGIEIDVFPKERRVVRIHAYDMSVQDILTLFEKSGKYKFHIIGKIDLSKKTTFNFIAIPDHVIFILLSEDFNFTVSQVLNVVKEDRLDYIFSEKLTEEK